MFENIKIIMNFYEILHVSPDAPTEVIKGAYKVLAQKYHPDRYKGDDANEIMVKIREAYETLIDPQKRKEYDAFLEAEMRKKQQHTEFQRKQKEQQYQQQAAPSNQGNQNASFNLNISVNLPFKFNILKPLIKGKDWLIKCKNWLVSKKQVFILLLIIFSVILFLFHVFNTLISESQKSQTSSHETKSYENRYEYNHLNNESNNEAAIAAMEAADEATKAATEAAEAVAAAEAAASFDGSYETSEETLLAEYSEGHYPLLNNNPAEIKNAVLKVLEALKNGGLPEIQALISNCYITSTTSKDCVYLDIAGKYVHDVMTQGDNGIEAMGYFDPNTAWQRILSEFYNHHSIPPTLIQKHAKDTIKDTTELLEKTLDEIS
ncbi:J domain-containing protein [Acinetobacter schindleri]|uniref:J domain-containing protein n=1 Tax=Acinetobacter schindleri TaxID=108981 RepID=UPI00241E27F9|nr:DnaJ domain-containing protein [Acinetobacter schindleri]